MNALSGAAIFVVQTLVSLYLVIVLLRFVLQLVKANQNGTVRRILACTRCIRSGKVLKAA